jgi:uncharacterized protein (DUF305 family)
VSQQEYTTSLFSGSLVVLVVAVAVLISGTSGTAFQQAPPGADPKPRPDLVRAPYSDADVQFMAGMIPHHAQAVLMASMARSHQASPALQMMCERMLISQRDEIEYMRNWLRDRGQYVPAADATHHKMKHGDMEHDMLMPGMLTSEEMSALDKARGAEWDRLFMIGMIKHHMGALKMVDDLFETHGALQDDDLFKFASDIYADQQAEIERMEKMLNTSARKGAEKK